MASYFFYAQFNLPLSLFLVIITLVNYIFVKLIERRDEYSNLYLKLGIIANILVLAFYKYLNFSFRLIGDIFKIQRLRAFNFELLVPLGISFIIFHAISYLVDDYKEKLENKSNFIDFSLYLAFFPKLVQGPIIKAQDLIHQFGEKHKFNVYMVRKGGLKILYGLFCKMVLADRIAIAVNYVYANPKGFSGSYLVLATILYLIQLYLDFSGYSYMASGSAEILGFKFGDNFRHPLLSTSVSEFWRRWHITLNEWLIEYVYIPLGGSRVGKLRTYINIFITFTLSGLWHGASGGFIIWGFLNGFFVSLEKALKIKVEKSINPNERKDKGIIKALKTLITFIVVSFTFLFFRAEKLSTSKLIIERVFSDFRLDSTINTIASLSPYSKDTFMMIDFKAWRIVIVFLLIVFIVDLLQQKYDVFDKVLNLRLVIRWLIYLLLILSIVLWGIYGYGYDVSNFIYSEF